MSLEDTGPKQARLLPDNLEDRLMGWTYRLAGAFLVLICVAGWLTLLAWSASDPSLSHATGSDPVNLLGPLGAIASDLALQMLGLTSIIALLAPAFWGVQLATSEYVPQLRLKCALYPVSVLVLAGAFSSLPVVENWPLNHGYGGIVGDLVLGVATGVLSIINPQRAVIAAGLMFFAGGFAALFGSLGLTQQNLQQLWQRSDDSGARAARGAQVEAGAGLSAVRQAMSSGGLLAGFKAMLGGRDPRHEPDLDVGGGPDPGFCPADADSQAGGWGGGNAYRVREQDAGDWSAPGPDADDGEFEPRLDFGVSRDGAHGDKRDGRGKGSSSMTDRDGRAMAARFAPAGAVNGAAADDAGDAADGSAARAPPGRATGFLQGLKTLGAGRRAYKRPSLNMLKRPQTARPGPEFTQTVLRGNARLLEDVLADFGIKGEVKDIKPGPVVTVFELEPARGTKASRVISLSDDIARSMSATSARIAVVPGRNVIGIELPNMHRETVLLRELLEVDGFRSSAATLPLALGKSIAGNAIVADLARMPHLLVAGTTGSGKSVGINAMILSLLYRMHPDQCRLLMIDPKMLELSVYNGIPHLLCPVVTDPQKAVAALAWTVREMEERYKRMSRLGVRNIDIFNNRVKNAKKRGETLARTVQTGFDKHSGTAIYEREEFDLEPMPYIVVVIDEFADLMSLAGKEIEALVQRLAQMARAAGIHLIMATQRPSVDIITGTIKANFPTRISFKVTSKIDSRTILGEQGAEQLLGHGDMLYSGGAGQVARIHGALVSDEEVEQIAAFLREQGAPVYVDGITEASDDLRDGAAPGSTDAARDGSDDLYERAVAIVLRDARPSTSYVQRRLSIGYNRAADLIERMEREGIVSAANPAGKRQLLAGGPAVPSRTD